MNSTENWEIYNPPGKKRILATSVFPGQSWLDILSDAGYRIELWVSEESLSVEGIVERIGSNCTAVIGQLTEKWDSKILGLLKAAGGVAYCNYAVGYDNVDLEAATLNNIAVGNTPGVLTEATAEMSVALTMVCSRRINEADEFTRNGRFKGWMPDLLLGKRLWNSTLGVIGAGRIGSSYAKMMVRAFQMNLIYSDHKKNVSLEADFKAYNEYLMRTGGDPISVTFAKSVDDTIINADVISLHVPLTAETRHMISKPQLLKMKPDAVLINTSRGAVINEADLAEHCKTHAGFTAGLDVFEFEPIINEDLKKLPNVTMAPHIASATGWTRENMAKLAALNVKGVIEGYPLWDKGSIDPFLGDHPPRAIPSILNKSVLKDF
jgi:lactate dehydrogenase-like 2-hydroxyacid dehydrogenase